ncbi:MAG: DUF58 domain-containing protein [Planctomycetes bacterium]|nr:DUF58 domain-containing protein [Planctomycetota bacterium]
MTPAPRAQNDRPAGAETLADVLAEVRRIPLRSSRFVTDVLTGGYRSTFRGAGVEFEEVREYSEGDDPRHVDWNVTARAGRPFVKRFVEEREHTLMFALDRGAAMQAGFGAWSPAQVGARFCALLGLLAIANNDGVGFAGGDADRRTYVPPRKGHAHVLAVLQRCAVGDTGGASDLGALLAEISRRTRRRTVVFLISDFLTLGYGRELRFCARHHDLVAVRLIGPELIDPPAAIVRAREPVTGRMSTVDLGSRRVRRAWLERVAAWRAVVDGEFAAARVDVVDIRIPRVRDIDAIAAPLQQFFRLRERREVYR